MPNLNDNIFVGLDVGTTKVACVVARLNAEGGIDILGVGNAKSTGIRRGVVVNIDATATAIKESIDMASRMSGVTIKTVVAGIAGNHIQSFNSQGVASVKGKEVTASDIARAIDSASKKMPIGYEVLHVLPQQFKLDGQDEIKDPTGMCGVRLEVFVHIITGAVSSAENIVKACEKAGVAVADINLEQLASAEAVLTDDEKEIGVCLLDGGGGTTDLAVYSNGAVYHTAVLQIGGNNFTKDLTSGLSTSEAEAERLKINEGCVVMDMISPDDIVVVPSVGGREPRSMPKSSMVHILQERAVEMLEIVASELEAKKVNNKLSAGVVLTGGFSNFRGIEFLARQILATDVRIGLPINIGGLSDQVANPIYATAVGLAKLHAKKGIGNNIISSDNDDGENFFSKVKDRMSNWLKEFF